MIYKVFRKFKSTFSRNILIFLHKTERSRWPTLCWLKKKEKGGRYREKFVKITKYLNTAMLVIVVKVIFLTDKNTQE